MIRNILVAVLPQKADNELYFLTNPGLEVND